ncbi:MAG: restriction endonuclease subunit S [bacterium JZ-2024 1]
MSASEGPYKLPEGWQWVRLGEVCDYERRSIAPKRFGEKLFYLYSIPAYDAGQIPERLSGSQIGSSKLLLGSNVCLFSKLNPRIPRAWVVAEVPQDGVAVASTEFMPLRPNPQILDLNYLGNLLMTEGFLSQVRPDVTGATGSRQRLRPEVVLNAILPLPPLSEQRRIVARIEELMGRIREARRLREEARQDTERLWQAVLAETFPRPGSELPEGWRWVRLGEVCSVFSGVWGDDPVETPPPKMRNVRVIRVSDIEESLSISYESVPCRLVRESEVTRYSLREGDLVVVKSSGSKAKVISGRAALFKAQSEIYLPSNFTFALRPNHEIIDALFIWYWLNAEPAKAIVASIVSTFTYPNLKKADYVQIPLPLPPLSEQGQIVAYLEAVQARIQALKEGQTATEAELKRLEQAILEKAFRGEL